MRLKSKPESAEGAEIRSVSASGRLTELIIGAAIEVHRQTGPGLMESVYEECLCFELSRLGLAFKRQVELPDSEGLKLLIHRRDAETQRKAKGELGEIKVKT